VTNDQRHLEGLVPKSGYQSVNSRAWNGMARIQSAHRFGGYEIWVPVQAAAKSTP